MQIIVSFLAFLLVFVSQVWAGDRVVGVTYLNWYSSVGAGNGCYGWKYNEYGYRNSKISGVKNYPLASQLVNQVEQPFGARQGAKGATDALKADIEDIKWAGFDYVAVDLLPIPPDSKELLEGKGLCGSSFFEFFGNLAAAQGLKSVVFSDRINRSHEYPSGRFFTKPEWTSVYSAILTAAKTQPWYWKIDGRPVVFQFATSEGSIGNFKGKEAVDLWYQIVSELESEGLKAKVYFDLRPEVFTAANGVQNNRGAFVFAPGAPQGYISSMNKTLLKLNNDIVWTVSPAGYYRQSLGTFIPPDFKRIHYGYLEAIQSNVDKMLLVTWNDFEEDTDIAPSANKGRALLWLTRFYNEWFKTRKQPLPSGPILISATPRTLPLNVVSGAPAWAYRVNVNNEMLGVGRGYYWVYSPGNSVLRLNGQILARLGKGVSFGDFEVKPGAGNRLELDSGQVTTFDIQRIQSESQGKDQGGLEYHYQIAGE